MSSRDNRDEAPQRRLRVPAALAVAFVGSSAMISIWYGGCDPHMPDPLPDAGRVESKVDAEVTADVDAIADVDAGQPDAPPDAAPADPPPDANEPPH